MVQFESVLAELAPYLVYIAMTHNGTWVAQRVVSLAESEAAQQIIAGALQADVVRLIFNQYGNYVVQRCLRFRRLSAVVFRGIRCRCAEVAVNRFGNHVMRSCLSQATPVQARAIVGEIIQEGRMLARDSKVSG